MSELDELQKMWFSVDQVPSEIYERGACVAAPKSYFFSKSNNPDSYIRARAICQNCPVKEPCLAYAMRHAGLDGFWGGTSPMDRKTIRRRIRLKTSLGLVVVSE